MDKQLLSKTWVLLQHKSRHYIGIILEMDHFFISIIGYRDNVTTFKRKEVKIIKYKPNIRILPIGNLLTNNPDINHKVTKIVETIKKQKQYNLILTNNTKFSKKGYKTQINKTQKTTLWKKFYEWIDNPKTTSKVTPILFFSNEDLKFFVVISKLGKVKFLNKNFEEIQKFSNKSLNVLLKSLQKNNNEEENAKYGLKSVFGALEITEEFLENTQH